MAYHFDDTICAIATATGGAARGMVRVSGPDAVGIVSQLFISAESLPLDKVRQPTSIAGKVRIEAGTERESPNPPGTSPYNERESLLPCDLFLWPTARSYTRQPVVELHTLGSPPLVEALLTAVCRVGARLAEPGEFTLRAFLAGRLDLTQAEGVLGVIDARGDEELRGAVAQLAGGLARPLHQLREELLQLLAELEAGLDFADDDIQFISSKELCERIASARRAASEISQQMTARHTTAPLLQIALTGRPNAGKSSLFNSLIARRANGNCDKRRAPALVSPQRGTTRDYLTATIELDGIRCNLIDTAGLVDHGAEDRQQASAIERAAHEIAVDRRAQSTLRVCCVDASQNIDSEIANVLRYGSVDAVVLTKSDIAPQPSRIAVELAANVPVIATSSRTGAGLDELCVVFRDLLTKDSAAQYGQVVAATADRCRESVRLAEMALRRAQEIAALERGDELLAAELRIALSELGKVAGAVYTDDLLDRIFSTFCIGK